MRLYIVGRGWRRGRAGYFEDGPHGDHEGRACVRCGDAHRRQRQLRGSVIVTKWCYCIVTILEGVRKRDGFNVYVTFVTSTLTSVANGDHKSKCVTVLNNVNKSRRKAWPYGWMDGRRILHKTSFDRLNNTVEDQDISRTSASSAESDSQGPATEEKLPVLH